MHFRARRAVRFLGLLVGFASFGASACRSEPPESAPQKCGNGVVEAGETCDDGNTTEGDACSAACQKEPGLPSCGDGAVTEGEQCDDGNAIDGDGCSATCQSDSQPPMCGNSAVETGEGCDDGNTIDGDGCSATCFSEGICGNGVLDPGEQCDHGGAAAGDGCEADCSKTLAKEIVCADLAPLSQGTCEVKAGDAAKLISGTVLVPGTIYRGGQVLVDPQGKIACVGCDCAAQSAGATTITCPAGVISPGLINTHDHITFAHNSPPADSGERFEHRHDWRLGLHCHSELSAAGGATDNEIRWGELRFLLGGATSTAGAGSATGLLRNLDKADQEGLGQKQVMLSTFPLGDSSGAQFSDGCPYPNILSKTSTDGADALLAHVSEGINDYARNEFACVSSTAGGGEDLLMPKTGIIHGIDLLAQHYAEMGAEGSTLIWSPRSNVALYGDTAPVAEAARLGVKIALGTDWISSGSMNLLRELQCADTLDKTYYDDAFTDEELWLMVTANAARATATDDVIGVLETGKVADISIWNGAAKKDHRAIIDAEPADVVLVLRGGAPMYGDSAVVEAIPASGACDALDVCGAGKRVCLTGDTGLTLDALKTSVGSQYPAFFCGAPENEPSCLPARPPAPSPVDGSSVYTGQPSAGDADGDGISNEMDNCPSVFNPIRPVDHGAQADYDADKAGDACDACPLSAKPAPCAPWIADDKDADGVPNVEDNCWDAPNAAQGDGDKDGKGDACDACPAQSNAGGAPCDTTIYAIKTGVMRPGTYVALKDALVTAMAPNGYFVQIKPGDPGDMGSDNSGLFVYQPNSQVSPGDRITIEGAWVAEFFGQVQLSSPITKVEAKTGEAPDPVTVTAPEIMTCGPRSKALEGVLVTVAAPAVTAVTSPDKEFQIDDALVVDDLLYLTTPFPKVGDPFELVQGILSIQFGDSKLAPRGPTDLLGTLLEFGPSLSFVYVDTIDAATIPSALTVTLSRPAPTDTFISITSGDPELSVVGGGVMVAAGQTSAPLLVSSGGTPIEAVTLTAGLGAASLTADVRIVDPFEQPVLASIGPSALVPVNGKATFSVSLDIPTQVPVDVALALDGAALGIIPSSVTIGAGQTTATFEYTAGMTKQVESITATLGAETVAATATVVGRLVINEVDYDQPSTDVGEFIELFNDTGADLDLAGYEIILVNGASSASYGVIDLSPVGVLKAGQYLVVCWSDVVAASVPATALVLKPSNSSGKIQNGDAMPDGIALIRVTTATLVDALSYKGSLTAATLPGFTEPMSLVEGQPTTALDNSSPSASVCRLPDGTDTDNALADFAVCAALTPGAPNVP
jgi:cysteine-rich repeat protein